MLLIGMLRFLFVSGSYILMLAVMTYNTGVFLVAGVGLAVGFILTPQTEHKALRITSGAYHPPEKFLRDPN